MKQVTKTMALGIVLVLVLVGCESVDEITKSADDISDFEDRSMADNNGTSARTQGLDGSSAFSASSLDDPNSPLAVRVIYFDYNSNQVKADYQPVVEAHATYLSQHPETIATLAGHADERGSREYNLALSERRALAIRRQMVLLGASANQIKLVGYGEEQPASDGHDEQAYALNRRVELLY